MLLANNIHILFIILFGITNGYQKETIYRDNETEDEFVDRIFDKYHKTLQPRPNNSGPLIVKVNMKVNDPGHFNDRAMTYYFGYTIHQLWRDERLMFKNFSQRVLKLVKMEDRVWRPDLYIFESVAGEKSASKRGESMLWFYENGNILYSEKRGQHLNCRLDLRRFPMDEQICQFRITSFGYNKSDIDIQWLFGEDNHRKNIEFVNIRDNVGSEEDTQGISEFKLVQVETRRCILTDTFIGQSACVKIVFHFYRNLGFYLLHTYLPSFLVVGISWLSFLVDFTSAPARASMGFISVLTIITQTSSSISELPRVSYTRAIDLWLFTCLAFVVTALVEFAFISSICTDVKIPISRLTKRAAHHHIMKKQSHSMPNIDKSQLDGGGGDSSTVEYVEVVHHQPTKQSERNNLLTLLSGQKLEKSIGYKIDGLFFVLYPICFGIFNLIYWTYFKVVSTKFH